MKITRIVVRVNGGSTDQVCLFTDLPSPIPEQISHPMVCTFRATVGKGVEYALANFDDIPVEVMDTETGERKRVQWYPGEGPGCWYGEPIEDKP